MQSPGELRLFDADVYRSTARMLRERFVVNPFSILEAGSGHWQARKRNWLSLGIKSEIGRESDAIYKSSSGRDPEFYRKKSAAEARLGRELSTAEFTAEHYERPTEGTGGISLTGTSVFDPVLCELAYRWWSPEGATILDPFAGGSVRGMVAAVLGRRYVGVELREEQVAANYEQSEAILPGIAEPELFPQWTAGDSTTDLPEVEADFVWTCPPYGDLERYSDDPRDLSTMDVESFATAYRKILRESARRLRTNRFLAIVVGNYRDSRTTEIRDLVSQTVIAGRSAGLLYYSDVILSTTPGSIASRASGSFDAGRKPVRRHQYVLVFVKGDWRKAAAAAERMPGRLGE